MAMHPHAKIIYIILFKKSAMFGCICVYLSFSGNSAYEDFLDSQTSL